MKNRQGNSAINSVLVTAIILVIVGSGFAAYRILIKPKAESNNTNSISNTGTADGWTTYTNPALKYSIKYPPDWTATTNSYNPEYAEVDPPDINEKTSPERSPFLAVRTETKIDTSDCSNTSIKENESSVTIGNTSYIRTKSGCPEKFINTYFPQGKGLTGYFRVYWYEVFSNDYPEYEKILSTFRIPD